MYIINKCDECGCEFKDKQIVNSNEKAICGKCAILMATKHYHEVFYVKGVKKDREIQNETKL